MSENQQPRWASLLKPRIAPAEDSPYAGYSERMLSAAIDLLIIMVVLRRVFGLIDQAIKPYLQKALTESRLQEVPTEQAGADGFTQLAVFFERLISSDVWFYVLLNHGSAIVLIVSAMTLMQYYFGTTPGRWVMGLKLTNADLNTSPNLARVALRYVVCIFSCTFFMLGLVWVMFTKKCQGWHDMAASTYVISTREKGWYWQKIKQGFRFLKGDKKPD